MKRELYEKVFIHSEEDLPKISGRYICYSKECGLDNYGFVKGYDELSWIDMIDWYLRPVPEVTDCNHVIGAADESGICIKCGKKVCEIINNNLHEKRES